MLYFESYLNRNSVKIQVADKYICKPNTHTQISLRNFCRDELAAQVMK